MNSTRETNKTEAELDALDYDCDWLTLCERYGETRAEWTFAPSGESVLIRKYGWVAPEIRERWELARGKTATTEAFSRRPRRRKRKKEKNE